MHNRISYMQTFISFLQTVFHTCKPYFIHANLISYMQIVFHIYKPYFREVHELDDVLLIVMREIRRDFWHTQNRQISRDVIGRLPQTERVWQLQALIADLDKLTTSEYTC